MAGDPRSSPAGRIEPIISTIINSLRHSYMPPRKKGKRLEAKIRVYGIPADYSDILSLPEAKQINVGGESDDDGNRSVPKGPPELPWLEWLLSEGQFTITGYYIVEKGKAPAKSMDDKFFLKYSRTGLAVMLKKGGGAWSLPEEYAAIAGNNFIVRAVQEVLANDVETILKGVF
jgi:hypothetical protein